MSYVVTDKHVSPSRVQVTVGETGRWSFDMTANLKTGETVATPTVQLVRLDTRAVVAGFVTSGPTVSGNTIVFNWTGSVLTAGQWYEVQAEYVASGNATPVVLLAVEAVA